MTVTWDEKTGEITINGTNTTNSTINFHLTKNLDVTKYSRREFTISMNNEQINDKVTIQFQTSNGGMYYSLKCDEINKVGVSRNKTFETKGVYLRCLSGCSVSNFKIRPQIEYGNVATEYEPYIEPVISNIYLDEPLRKIGDVADYIDFENQKLVRNVYNIRVPVDILKNLVKDSTRGQRYWDKNPIYPRAREAGSNGKISTVGKECYRLAYAYNDSFHWYIHNNDGDSNILVLVSPDDNTTLGEYFNNLSLEQDLDFAYVMEEPIEETIEVPPILTREGYNVIEVNTSTQPSNMLVKYNYSGTILD
ncbi:MAG: hypothetical protein IKA56_02110 [Clostridia bacterium]|nr:hypothetical protein [Clostridia bacterium]